MTEIVLKLVAYPAPRAAADSVVSDVIDAGPARVFFNVAWPPTSIVRW